MAEIDKLQYKSENWCLSLRCWPYAQRWAGIIFFANIPTFSLLKNLTSIKDLV
ncbi:hypothetical protein [Neobacillus novalis]|uniref:hypothetical protein n=1 Tax=Neobacillus novalis TaxID=220687 RepID=UPI001C3F2C6C|nr:hypothetical protein [Neobacillus novalis]